jgi:hypothetical protein
MIRVDVGRCFALMLCVSMAGGGLVVSGSDVDAQMMLPGANNGIAQGAAPKAGAGDAAPYVAPKPVLLKPPGEETIIGRTLGQGGIEGSMTFDRPVAGEAAPAKATKSAAKPGGLTLTKLVLKGDKISKPGEACTVDVSLSTPLALTAAGRPVGAIRYDVPISACPFSIDVLDGAVLVSAATPSCDFTAADCRITAGGLWGPASVDISETRIKELERQRQSIETTMRANFRVLLKKAGKDRAAVKAIAGQQAAFSSEREVACRDYDHEAVHGFCSTQMAEARALALVAQFETMAEGPHDRPRARSRARRADPVAPKPIQ